MDVTLPRTLQWKCLGYAPCWGVTPALLETGRTRLLPPVKDYRCYRRLVELRGKYLPEYDMRVYDLGGIDLVLRWTDPRPDGMYAVGGTYIGAGHHRILYSDGFRFRVEIERW